jgi:glycerol-3-phosphate dehydrogenase (NAD(P)+)
VSIYSRDENVVQSINKKHVNCKYLKTVVLPSNLVAVGPSDLKTALSNLSTCKELSGSSMERYNVIVICIPTQHLRSVLNEFLPLFVTALTDGDFPLVIMANKGIELETLSLPIQILRDVCEDGVANSSVCLSGPSFAIEVIEEQPTCVTVAGFDLNRASLAQKLFHSPLFRVYTCDDPIGVEVCGALKNVIAIASGMSSGLGYQMNTRAALLTRGLYEIARIGAAMGCKDMITFIGLSGMGDLLLTASSEKSRNFTLGYRMGRYGESLQEVLDHLGSVAEGVPTTQSAYRLCRKLHITTPIIDQMYYVLYQNKPLPQAVKDLLNQESALEFQFGK